MVRLFFIFIIAGSLALCASDIDLNESKGTDQSVIASLSPAKAQIDVWNNAKIEVSFNVPIDASSVQKNNIKLVHLSSKTNDHIDGSISYDKYDNKVVFVPSALLPVGTYEVEIKSLKADKAYKSAQIKEIKYRFYVPEVINGHQLPPEPDPAVNNSTLLGIDVNENGVRDDVERLIILEESKHPHFPKTHTAMSLQYAWAWQKIMLDPILKNRKYLEYHTSCKHYFINKHTSNMSFRDYRKWSKQYMKTVLGVKLEDKIFNTKERIQQRFKFNEACSGNIFDLPPAKLSACQVNIDELGE